MVVVVVVVVGAVVGGGGLVVVVVGVVVLVVLAAEGLGLVVTAGLEGVFDRLGDTLGAVGKLEDAPLLLAGFFATGTLRAGLAGTEGVEVLVGAGNGRTILGTG